MRILGIDPGSRITGYGMIESRGTACATSTNGIVVMNPKTRWPCG